MVRTVLICPFCRSLKLIKRGFVYTKNGKVQRYECKACRKVTIRPKKRKTA